MNYLEYKFKIKKKLIYTLLKPISLHKLKIYKNIISQYLSFHCD